MSVDYRRLTKRRRTPAGSSELWLATDHLLLVTRHWFTERYQRFRLSEIQLILIVERPSVRGIQIIGILAVAFFLALTLPGQLFAVRRILFGVPLSIVLVCLLVDLLRGPYCRVELATAVSAVRLPPLSRMRSALKFVEAITPPIEAAQGQWAPESIPVPAEWSISSPSSIPLPPPLPRQQRVRGTAMDTILFVSTFLVGVYTVFARHNSVPAAVWTVSWTLMAIPIVLGGIVAFGGQGGWKRVLAGAAAVNCVVVGFSSAMHYFTVFASAAKSGLDPYQAIARPNAQSATGDALGIGIALLGLIGLIVPLRRRAN